ncbi:Protein kinase kin1 [Tolypocladium ophioglossoides CBS 100239]|uniref:non-specific serine/threonine protein kinase n=1 Tax=Tolypocladium ophioglossoides (strain CBS 100239) TaxID=1163406 RepID=A0A0L0MX18_TOLOC|nr:Protein kinase kin1 [Tolypocladium ophioglossoides CBS 100239]
MTTSTSSAGSDYYSHSSSRAPPSRSYSARSSRPPPTASSGAATAASAQAQRPAPSIPSTAATSSAATSSNHNTRHHRRTSSATRPIQDVLPQNDYETAHLASYSKRSSSRDRDRDRDRDRPPPSRGAESSSSSSRHTHRRSSTRSNHRHRQPPPQHGQHGQPDMPPSAVPNNGSPSAASHAAAHGHADAPQPVAKQTRSRTTIPTQSGKWILGKTIGAGSMGKVKLARKEDGSEQVACKIVPRGATDDGHQSRADKERADQSKEIRTAREAAIVTLLNHPHICGMRDVVRTNYHWYMLFEYVNGGHMLDYIISHGKLKEKQARKFSRQIASALDYCHRNSIVHRDLKIENILISKTGDIKIIDFGLSNLFSPRGHLKTFCGSLYFAAPELLQARAYTGPEVDVWSFGIVLYVLVCGKVPFDDQSMPALHAKIKKGLVDYPGWLSSECKHLMARMLVTDPKQRATMQEVMSHPWMTKGFNGPPDNYLPAREPLSQPLNSEVVHAMQGFNFGSPESIKAQLVKIIESDEYQQAVKVYQREREFPQPSRDAEKRRGFAFDFYKRRNSGNSRDTLTGPSSEALQLGSDPLYAFSPLLSIYYLVKEKQEREQGDSMHPAAAASRDKGEKDRERERGSEAMPELAPPQAAHTNSATFEMPGEKPTGGRTRPRARTHGEDDAPDTAKHTHPPPPPPPPETKAEQLHKKEGTAAGLLRRFSTRKRRDADRVERDRSHPPMVQVHSPAEAPPATPKKSFSIRRGRQSRDDHSASALRTGGSQPQHSELLSPPMTANGPRDSRKSGLGRSTSVNSADIRRPREHNRIVKEPPVTSGSDQSVVNENPEPAQRGHGHSKSFNMRAKSLGHARRESIQRRRLKREGAQEADVPEETDPEQEQSGVSTDRLDSSDLAKPVFLKGLFSVSTTSGKSVPAIRVDIKRVLKQLNVDYTEIKGGFSCRHAPSIDLNKVQDPPGSPAAHTPGHRRRFSFGGLMRGDDRDRDEIRDMDRDRPPTTPRTPGRSDRDRSDRDRSYSNSETSVDSIPRRNGAPRRAPGETSTQVQSDLGGSMVMEFEIFIVKVPLLSLHGIQFKRLTGNTWQYKNMADQILRELKL